MTDIKNFYEIIPKKFVENNKRTYKNHKKINIDLTSRILICGVSGAMKTNTLMNIIQQIGVFTKLYLFVKDTQEPLYKYLIETVQQLEKKSGSKMLFVSEDVSDMPELSEFDREENNLVVFDDQVSEAVNKQKLISELWIRGRKLNCTCVFISQSYFDTSKILRKNTDYIILKRISQKRDLKTILSENNLNDTTPEKLLEFYKEITSKDMKNFLMIDLKTTDPKLKYRENFG